MFFEPPNTAAKVHEGPYAAGDENRIRRESKR